MSEGALARVDGAAGCWVAGKSAGGGHDKCPHTFRYNPTFELTGDTTEASACPLVLWMLVHSCKLVLAKALHAVFCGRQGFVSVCVGESSARARAALCADLGGAARPCVPARACVCFDRSKRGFWGTVCRAVSYPSQTAARR
jgi:hypothetical protein